LEREKPNSLVGFASKLRGQNVVAKLRNVSAGAAIVFITQVEFRRVEFLPVVIDALRVSADKLIDALFRVGKRDDFASFSKRLYDRPLVDIRVLELVKNYKGIRLAGQFPDLSTSMQDLTCKVGKEVKTDSAVFDGKARPFCALARLFFIALFLGQPKLGIVFSDPRQCYRFCRRCQE
jgi:hypothetical protein